MPQTGAAFLFSFCHVPPNPQGFLNDICTWLCGAIRVAVEDGVAASPWRVMPLSLVLIAVGMSPLLPGFSRHHP